MTKGMPPALTEVMDDDSVDRSAALEAAPPATPRHVRRLSDKIFVAFHQACDTTKLDVAEQLLRILEKMMSMRHTTSEGNRRHNMDNLVAAFERLWHLRHPEC